MKQPSILVIDDEPDNFDVIESFLSKQNYQLHYASSGENAIATLETFDPDLILLDVMMPKVDGITVCKQIKASSQWQIVPIIMVTALNTKSDLALCLQAGADDFISKPVNAIELRARIQSMLRIKQQYDDIQSLSQIRENAIITLQSTLNELRGSITTTLSHELNTPLNGIVGIIGLIKDSLADTSIDEIMEMLDLADQSAHRLENLTKKFLIYLELELLNYQNRVVKPITTTFCQSAIEPLVINLAHEFCRDQDLIINLEAAEVAISDRYLATIIHELIENALKFSENGTKVTLRSQVKHNLLDVWIEDTGRGMTEEQIIKIGAFMQFERKYYEQQGIGLGLKIVQKIIELVGGKFAIISTYKQSTTVNFALPIANSL